jgi:hypothetical protein
MARRPDPDILLGAEALGDAPGRLWRAVQPHRAVGAWATVELERGEQELSEALAAMDLTNPVARKAPDDSILGARCRALDYPGERTMLVLEPSTEGPLAAALARHGEGSVALYLLVDDDAVERAAAVGFRLSAERDGPLGPQRLVLGGPRWGPFLVLVRDRLERVAVSDGGAAPRRS